MLKHGVPAVDSRPRASGSRATSMAAGRLAGGEHVGPAMAAAGGAGSKRRDPPGRRRCRRRGLDGERVPGPAAPAPRGRANSSPVADDRQTMTLAVPGADDGPLGGRRDRRDVDPGPEGTSMRRSISTGRPSRSSCARRRPGDRFEPLGMGGQSMPLADFFRGRHVERARSARASPWSATRAASSGSSGIGSPIGSR